MSADDQYDEYLDTFDAVSDAMHDAALLASTTAAITPPVLYQALGNLRAATGALTEVLPSLARATRTGASDLELYDTDGNDPQQQLAGALHSPPTTQPTRRRPSADRQRGAPRIALASAGGSENGVEVALLAGDGRSSHDLRTRDAKASPTTTGHLFSHPRLGPHQCRLPSAPVPK